MRRDSVCLAPQRIIESESVGVNWVILATRPLFVLRVVWTLAERESWYVWLLILLPRDFDWGSAAAIKGFPR